MTAFFSSIIYFIGAYRYPVAFLGSLIEGPLAMVGGGMLVRLGEFDFIPLYLTLLLGDLTADILWYFVGRKAANPFIKRFGKFFGITQVAFEKMERVFLKHDTKILFISKVTMGLGFALATLMAAGAVKVPFKKFFILNAAGGVVWVAFLISVGYFFGDVYLKIADSFKVIFVGAAALSVIALMYGFVSYIRRHPDQLN
ncbi:MAG: DedA family protein [Patescibacteria group bacterium]